MKLNGLCSINGKDLWTVWGGLLQRGAYEVLMTPGGLKDFIENKSRLLDGTEVVVNNPKVEERSFSISIKIRGKDEEEYLLRYKSFINELQSGLLKLKIPALQTTFKVLYDGCTKYGNQGKKAGLFNIKFREPNPKDRIYD